MYSGIVQQKVQDLHIITVSAGDVINAISKKIRVKL